MSFTFGVPGNAGKTYSNLPVPNVVKNESKLWLDSTTLDLKDGDVVDPWKNKAGSTDAIAGGTNQGIFRQNILNGLPAVSLAEDGSADTYDVALSFSGVQQAFACVRIPVEGRVSGYSNFYILKEDGGDEPSLIDNWDSGNSTFYPQITGGAQGATYTAGLPIISLYNYDGENNDLYDKTATKVDTASVTSGMYVDTLLLFNNSTGNAFAGYVFEIIGFAKTLTTPEIEEITNYLRNKYDI